MLLVISPAKTLDMEPHSIKKFTQPRLLEQSETLVKVLRDYNVEQLGQLMHISDKLSTLNVDRYQQFEMPFDLKNAKQALLAFKGDVYQGLGAEDFDEKDLKFAQDSIRMLSGLYGVLRPLDLMQAYRLEMGTTLKTLKGKNLYDFWGDQITELLNKDAKGAIVNLASNEYWKAVHSKKLEVPVYTIHFKEKKKDKYRTIAFFAKKARGLMCRYAVKNRLTKPEELKNFDLEEYTFNEDLSSEFEFTFTRERE